MTESLVRNSELAVNLKLSVTGDELTALLVRWDVMILDYADLPGGIAEFNNIAPRYKAMELGCLLAQVKEKDGYFEPEWHWNQLGCKVVAALIRKLQFMDYREIAELIVKDALNPGTGSLDVADDNNCCKPCGSGYIFR